MNDKTPLPEEFKKYARAIINSIDDRLKAASNTPEQLEAQHNNYYYILDVVDKLRRGMK